MVKQSIEKPGEETESKRFRGIRKRKWGKYVSEIRLPNSRERIWLGSYDTAEKAARAFDAAMFCLRGSNANFNFPDNPPNIPGGRSMTPSQIQTAAARFANPEPHENHLGQTARTESSIQSSSEGMGMGLPMVSPSHSLSEGTVQTESDVTPNGLFVDLCRALGSGDYASDYGLFSGFDYFSGNFYIPEMPSVNYGEEIVDGLTIDDTFLWNF